MQDLLVQILQTIKYKQFTWDLAHNLLDFHDISDWDTFFSELESIWMKNYPKILKIYTPGKNFPAISVTGTDCALSCAHCDKKYLENMLPARNEAEFRQVLNKIIQQGSKGVLLSGGCTNEGVVPLLKYAKIMKEFKSQHEIFFNSHVGLVNEQEAQALFECGIDTVSFDLIMDPDIITNVFHLKVTPEDYLNSYHALKSAGLRVVPHILIGGNYGRIGQELKILQYLAQNPPEMIVFIVMIPPKMHNIPSKGKNYIFNQLNAEQIASFFLIARYFLPLSELSLGCMRPRGRISEKIEKWSIQAGATRIEIPTQGTIKWANKNGFNISYYAACCAIPNYFEDTVKAIDIFGKKV